LIEQYHKAAVICPDKLESETIHGLKGPWPHICVSTKKLIYLPLTID